MRKIFALSVAIFSVAALASGGHNANPFVCYFHMPTVHPVQDPGPYTGTGKTLAEAKDQALALCKKDLDDWMPGSCETAFADSSKMECSQAGTK